MNPELSPQPYIHPDGHTTQTIWNACYCKIRSFIYHQVRDQALTDDLIQEVFIKIHENLNSLKDGKKIHYWVFRIVRNTITDYFRKHNRNFSDSQEDLISDSPVSTMKFDYGRDLESELRSGILPVIKSLPEKYAKALLWSDFEGLSQTDLAKWQNISYSAVKSRVQRARQMVKDRILNCCRYEFDKYGTIIGVDEADSCKCK